MKRVLILFVSLCIVYATWAESMDIRSLHHLSNTMEHKEFVEMAITHDSLTRSITTAQWYEELNLISTDTISMQLLPTLYDLIADKYYDLFGKNRDSVLSAWQAFHADDESPLPRLYIQLNRRTYIPPEEYAQLYTSLPAGWERGYVLTRYKPYRNDEPFYHYLCEYLEQFPSSPFVPELLHRKQVCEQIELDYSYPQLLSTTDSLTITYSNTNAREIIFELYRLPDKMPKKGSMSAPLMKVDSLRVTTDTPLIFRLLDQQCKMKPQPFGTYFIHARVPEDTLQEPIDSIPFVQIYFRTLTISNLRCLLMQEGSMKRPEPWIIVTDIHTGQPLHHVKVKPYKQLARYTNQNGEVRISKRKSYFPINHLSLGEDKYHHPDLSNRYFSDNNNTELIVLPNATIFRPGDTLHIAFIGQKRHKFRYSLPKNKPVRVYFNGPQWKRTDTTLVLDDDATATLAVPFTDDMRRGVYSIYARMDDSYAAYVSVRLEDYRLPSFSVAFDDSCRTMARAHLKPVTGKALRSNGTPLAGATVIANVDFGRYL